MHTNVFSYTILGIVPIWLAAFVLDFFIVDILFLGREHYEGFAYNISRSSQYGDRALIACILIGATVLQRGVAIPAALNSGIFNWISLGLAFAVGVVWVTLVVAGNGWKFVGTVMDTYHNFFIVPVLLYLLTTMIPLTFCCGSAIEKIATILLLALWTFLVWLDSKHGRLQQCKWLEDNGFGFILRKKAVKI
jgi:hypothetical protein